MREVDWGMGWLLRLPTRLLIAGAVVSAVAAWLCGAWSNTATGPERVVWLTAGAILTAFAVGLPLLVQVKARRERDDVTAHAVHTQEQVLLAVQDTLDPFVNLLARITTAATDDEREQLRAAAILGLVEAGAQLIGPDRSRASYYALDEGPPRALRPTPFSAGRAIPPSQVFIAGTRLGDDVIGLVDRGEHRFVADVAATPPPGWGGTEHGYRTFISVPVGTEAAKYGMLSIDAPEPGDLTVVDVPFVRLLAGLLTTALGTGATTQPPRPGRWRRAIPGG